MATLLRDWLPVSGLGLAAALWAVRQSAAPTGHSVELAGEAGDAIGSYAKNAANPELRLAAASAGSDLAKSFCWGLEGGWKRLQRDRQTRQTDTYKRSAEQQTEPSRRMGVAQRGREGGDHKEIDEARKKGGVGKILRDLIDLEKGKKYAERRTKREGSQRSSERKREGQ